MPHPGEGPSATAFLSLPRRGGESHASDTSVQRKRAKEAAVRKLCELPGLVSLRQSSSADQSALQALEGITDQIDDRDLHSVLGVPAPRLDERTVMPARGT